MIPFNNYAHKILNRRVLIINNQPHRILEIEFYLTCSGHTDPFTHQETDQAIPDRWYFHKKEGTFKGGTFKALDITFRPIEVSHSQHHPVYGGILIRSIMNLTDGTVIEGPCQVVDHILTLSSASHIKDFVNRNHNHNLEINDETSQLYLRKKEKDFESKLMFNSPRIGLSLKNNDKLDLRYQYIMKNYRYVIYPELFKKYRRLIASNLIESGFKNNEIAKYLKMTSKQVENTRNVYEEGKKTQFSSYHGNLKSDDLVKLMGLCNNRYDC